MYSDGLLEYPPVDDDDNLSRASSPIIPGSGAHVDDTFSNRGLAKMIMQLEAQMLRQEERRERQMQMTTNKVTNHRTAPVPSSGNSSNTVPDINMVKRTFSRLKSESNNEIENLNRTLDEDKPEQYIRRYVKNLYRCKARIEQISDKKMTCFTVILIKTIFWKKYMPKQRKSTICARKPN